MRRVGAPGMHRQVPGRAPNPGRPGLAGRRVAR
jgi:hypothetical protein